MSPLRGEHADKPTYRVTSIASAMAVGDDVFLAHHEIFS